MFIDIHVHTRRLPGCNRIGGEKNTYATPEQLLAAYDELGIERGVLLPGSNPECSYTPQCNEDVLELAQQSGGRFIPFCNVDPRAISNSWLSPLDVMLKYFRDLGCKGIGEVCANLPILDPLVQNLFKCAEKAGLPLTFHLSPFVGYSYGLVDDQGLFQLEKSLQRFPNLKFFGHSQAFWAEISAITCVHDRVTYPAGEVHDGRLPQLFRKYPNLYGDLSAGSGCNALKRDRRHAAAFLHEFQDRLFFGTDICQPTMPTLRPLAEFLLDLRTTGEISESVFQKVARENAIRVLGL